MSYDVTMSYGTYSFRPVPMVSFDRVYELAENGTQLGLTVGLTLEGTIIPTGADGGPASSFGLASVDAHQDALSAAVHSQNGQLFTVDCNGTNIISGYPIVKSVSFPTSRDNWVNTSPYTIELEYYEQLHPTIDPTGYYIRNANESWSMEFSTERSVNNFTNASGLEAIVTHNIGAIGKTVYVTGSITKPAWERARDYVIDHLTENPNTGIINSSGIMNLKDFSYYDHIRSNIVDQLAGSFSVTETWLLSKSASHVKEDFAVSVRSGINDGLTYVTVDGTIYGLETRLYGGESENITFTQTKYAAASGFYDTLNILSRISPIINGLNTIPLSIVVNHNPTQGTVTYNHEYNDRPVNCVTNALSEIITVNDTNPTDVFASIPVCGRARGPVLQDISTVTAARRDVIVEVVVKPTGCAIGGGPRSDVESFLVDVYNNLVATAGSNAQVFKDTDNESWNPTQGRYSRQIGWTYQSDSTIAALPA